MMEFIIAWLVVVYIVALLGVLAIDLFGDWEEKPQLCTCTGCGSLDGARSYMQGGIHGVQYGKFFRHGTAR